MPRHESDSRSTWSSSRKIFPAYALRVSKHEIPSRYSRASTAFCEERVRSGFAEDRVENAFCFIKGFFILPFGIRVGDNACADIQVSSFSLDHQTSDDDIHVHISGKAKIPQGTGVRAAGYRLKFVNNFHAPHLRSAGNRPSRKKRF